VHTREKKQTNSIQQCERWGRKGLGLHVVREDLTV
jgi:hypothetical protein